MGSDQKIVDKTVPVGMHVNFRTTYLVCFFCVCDICVYCLAAIKHKILIVFNLDIYQEQKE